LRSKRVYKDAFPHEECVSAIRKGAGTQFDPDLVEVFIEIESEFDAIARRFASFPTEEAEPSDQLIEVENDLHSCNGSVVLNKPHLETTETAEMFTVHRTTSVS